MPNEVFPQSSSPVNPLAYSIKDAAQVCGVTPWTLRTAVAESRLLARRLGKRWIILHSDLERFLKNIDPVSPATQWLEKRKKAGRAA